MASGGTPTVPEGWQGCPSCGAVGPPEHLFCYRCGTRMPPPTVPVHPCPSCGSLVDERNQTFCGKCGRPLGGTAGSTAVPVPHVAGAPPDPSASPPGHGRSSLLPWALVGALAVALLLVGGLWAVGYPSRAGPAGGSPAPPGAPKIVGIDWAIGYTNGSANAFGPPSSALCDGCPVMLDAHGHATVAWTLSNTLRSAVPIDGLRVAGPFQLASVSPPLPQSVPAKGSLQLEVGVTLDGGSGDYVLEVNATVG